MMCRKLNMLPIECIVRGIHHRKRLGKLQGEWHCMRHQASGGTEGIRQAA